ncbi:hypothetical protein KKH59_00110 [Patescibacteria group bacterium]|nr:hypothetical protein [Patescibacteria group bacterium]
MESKTKIIIIIFCTIILLIVLWLGFKKNNDSVPVLPVDKTAEENLVVQRATFFAGQYGSYAWGEFTSIEGLYGTMSEKLKKETSDFIAKKKEEIKNQPVKWLYYNTVIDNFDLTSFNSEAATVKIGATQTSLLEKKEVTGDDGFSCTEFKSLDDCTNPAINPVASLIFEKTKKKQTVIVEMIKENNEWKIDSIAIKNKE